MEGERGGSRIINIWFSEWCQRPYCMTDIRSDKQFISKLLIGFAFLSFASCVRWLMLASVRKMKRPHLWGCASHRYDRNPSFINSNMLRTTCRKYIRFHDSDRQFRISSVGYGIREPFSVFFMLRSLYLFIIFQVNKVDGGGGGRKCNPYETITCAHKSETNTKHTPWEIDVCDANETENKIIFSRCTYTPTHACLASRRALSRFVHIEFVWR